MAISSEHNSDPAPVAILRRSAVHRPVDADGFAVNGAVEPGTDFYLRRAPGTSGITHATEGVDELRGRVFTGVALDDASQRFTPVALAILAEMNIEFGISWQAPGLVLRRWRQ